MKTTVLLAATCLVLAGCATTSDDSEVTVQWSPLSPRVGDSVQFTLNGAPFDSVTWTFVDGAVLSGSPIERTFDRTGPFGAVADYVADGERKQIPFEVLVRSAAEPSSSGTTTTSGSTTSTTSSSSSSQGSTTSPPSSSGSASTSSSTSQPTTGSHPDWGDPSSKLIRPGMTSSVCTTSFLAHHNFERYFLVSAAHCTDTRDTGGSCQPTEGGIGDREALEFGFTGTVAYNAWTTMNRLGITGDVCEGNDFALIEIDPEDWDQMHPSPYGPLDSVAGLGDCRDLATGDPVLAYGRSNLRTGLGLISSPDLLIDEKQGIHLGTTEAGFTCHSYLVTPAIPGDSGGWLASPDGLALGTASRIILTPTTGSNYYTNIVAALEFMEQHEGWAPEIVVWPEP